MSAFDALSALSVVLDLANGLAEDKSVVTATFAWELARAEGQPAEVQRTATLAALLRHLGCTAFASVEAEVAGDDIALRRGLHVRDSSKQGDVLAAVLAGREGMVGKVRGAWQLVTHGAQLKNELVREACGAARLLSDRLALGAPVTQALDEVFERFDGRGGPNALRGEAISIAGRIATTAHVASTFALHAGVADAHHVLGDRSGHQLDPRLADRARTMLAPLADAGGYLAARAPELARFFEAHPVVTTTEALVEAFGDFADLQLPAARGHSRLVASLCADTAGTLALSAREREQLIRAAHVHDLGQVAVPTNVWTAPRTLRPSELERARAHVFFTERILASAKPLAELAPIAGLHHERLDGSGYHRGSKGVAVPRTARVLAVCDVLCALVQDRPHRPARALASAFTELRAEAKRGALDEEIVEAAIAARGGRARTPEGTSLSARELEVLRLVAKGKTNKEVASTLGLSPRTVQHHTIHIYEKLGVDTRAGAAMEASRRGLLGVGE